MTEPSNPTPPSGFVPAPRSPRDDIVAGLDVAVRRRRADTVVRVVGELDAATAPRFVAVVDSVLVEAPVRTVWCDVGDLTFVAAAGLSALETALRLAGAQGADLQLVGSSRPLHRVLSLTGTALAVRPGGAPDDAPPTQGEPVDCEAGAAESARRGGVVSGLPSAEGEPHRR